MNQVKQNKTRTLYEILTEDLGFKQNIIDVPINSREQWKQDFLPNFLLKIFPVKTENKTVESWLVNKIGDNSYEVLFDDYNVMLRKNGEMIFDKRRFDDKEFISLLV